MKKHILLLLLFLAGCGTSPKTWDSQTNVYGLDFRDYNQQGFLFTPNVYDGDYESLGIVNIQLIPAVTKTQGAGKNWRRGYSANSDVVWWIEVLDTRNAIDQAYREASSMGADALSQFEISEGSVVNGDMEVPTLEITGFAIKRR